MPVRKNTYVALVDLHNLYAMDIMVVGTYVVKAVNDLGQVETKGRLIVKGM